MTRYTHYQAMLPDRSSTPTRSGNYILKVFRNNDTSNLYFTKRFLVVDNKVAIAAQIKQPFSPQLYLTDQRVMGNTEYSKRKDQHAFTTGHKSGRFTNNTWSSAAFVDRQRSTGVIITNTTMTLLHFNQAVNGDGSTCAAYD